LQRGFNFEDTSKESIIQFADCTLKKEKWGLCNFIWTVNYTATKKKRCSRNAKS